MTVDIKGSYFSAIKSIREIASNACEKGEEVVSAVKNSANNAIKSAMTGAEKRLMSTVDDVKRSIVSTANAGKQAVTDTAFTACVSLVQAHQEDPRKFYIIASMATLGAITGVNMLANVEPSAKNDVAQSWLVAKVGLMIVDAAWCAVKYMSVANIGVSVGAIVGCEVHGLLESYEQKWRQAAEVRRIAAEEETLRVLRTTKKKF